jgi:exodeoxyribonuclease VII small subunit
LAKKRPKKKPSDTPSFEQALETLERIVGELEEGSTGLGESLKRFEEGVKLLGHCHETLQNAQRKIELVTGVDAQGNPISAPLDDSDRSLEEKAEGASRRRAMRSPAPPTGEDSYTEGTDMDSSEGLF